MERTEEDSYLTLAEPAEALYKEKGSKFLAYAYPVSSEEQIRECLEALRKRYYDATHHCYAWRLGADGQNYRVNDDGEPSSTAGRPILGQLLSYGVTDVLVVVVRYFGGTKLGVSGLIAAYKESAAAVLSAAQIVERTVDVRFEVEFGYLVMNDVMRVVKEMRPEVLEQRFDNLCTMQLSIRAGRADALRERLQKIEGIHIENQIVDWIMGKKNLVSVTDFSCDEILRIMELAAQFEADPHQQVLAGKVIASLFFEPSTRTRLSFESAINHLGGRVIGFSETANTSVSKGETFHDTIMVISNYCDMIVMRHSIEGAARYASEISKVPVVNAGDGANQHPSQTLLDLYSIKKTQGTLDNLHIVMVGDLKYGRTVHSLLQALSFFNPTFTFVAPDELKMPDEYKLFWMRRGSVTPRRDTLRMRSAMRTSST